MHDGRRSTSVRASSFLSSKPLQTSIPSQTNNWWGFRENHEDVTSEVPTKGQACVNTSTHYHACPVTTEQGRA